MRPVTAIDISYTSLLRVALPLSLGAFVQFLVVLTDNLFLSRVSENALNGAGNGGMLYVTAVMLGVGLSAGVQIVVARRSGEQQVESIGSWLGSGLRLALFLSVLLFLVYLGMDVLLFDHILNSAEILKVMREFLSIRMFGLFVYLPTLMFTGFYTGIARTGVLTISMGLTAGLNILFDYLLVFGIGPFPAMEHEGAALATLIAETSGLLFILIYTFRRYGKTEFMLYRTVFLRKAGQARRLLSLSYPIMVQQVLALATWTTFYFLVEKVGGMELKVSHIVRNTYLLAFVTVMGVGYTTRTIVSTLIAENRQGELGKAIQRLIVLNMGGALLLCHGLIAYPEAIASLFFSEDDPGFLPLIRSFRVVFFAIVVFSVSSILLNTIEGSGRTRQAMRIELAVIAIYLGLVYVITIVNPQPIHVIWMSDYLYFGLLAAGCAAYLKFSSWKYTSV
jgi:putative MATE family efflux protein